MSNLSSSYCQSVRTRILGWLAKLRDTDVRTMWGSEGLSDAFSTHRGLDQMLTNESAQAMAAY